MALLRRVKPYLDVNTLNVLYKALLQPHFDYCSVAWYGRFKKDCGKRDVIQKRCARIILSADYYTPSESMFNELRWERLSHRNQYFKALMMYQYLHNLAPQYLTRKLKGSRMCRSVKVSLWYVSLLINTRFRFSNYRISNC